MFRVKSMSCQIIPFLVFLAFFRFVVVWLTWWFGVSTNHTFVSYRKTTYSNTPKYLWNGLNTLSVTSISIYKCKSYNATNTKSVCITLLCERNVYFLFIIRSYKYYSSPELPCTDQTTTTHSISLFSIRKLKLYILHRQL